MIYTVTLSPAVDYTLTLDRLLTGETNRAATARLRAGGKGINVSFVLAALGRPTTALGLVAGMTGGIIEGALREAGIPTDLIRLPEGQTRINVKITADTETEIAGVGPMVPAWAVDALMDKLDALLVGDTLVLAGSLPASLPPDTYAAMLARVAGRGVRVAVDTVGDALWRTLPYRPYLIKPNRRELEALCGVSIKSDGELLACARRLQEAGARNVLVSLGGDGAFMLDENGGIHRAAAHRGRVMGTVGAGDSMVAGFLVGSEAPAEETPDYAYALRVASAAAGATAFCEGLCDRAGVEALLGGPLP